MGAAVGNRWRWAAPAAVYLGILGLSSIPASRFESLGAPAGLSYLAHAVEYGTLGATLRWALDDTARPSALVVGMVVLLGGGDELWQSTVPGRQPSVVDLAVDVAAAGAAAAAVGRWRGGPRAHAPRPPCGHRS